MRRAVQDIIRRVYLAPGLKTIFRTVQRVLWLARFYARRPLRRFRPIQKHNSDNLRGLEEVPGFFINLARRADRCALVEDELSKLGLVSLKRFPAISHEIGILGCTLSHAEVMKQGKAELSPFMVCEDDVEFLATGDEVWCYIREFLDNPELDVLCLAFNLGATPHRISARLRLTNDTQTASCYVVKPRARRALELQFGKGAKLLARGHPAWAAANDIVWKRLQRTSLAFAIPRVPLAKQRESFSDVEGKVVDYGV